MESLACPELIVLLSLLLVEAFVNSHLAFALLSLQLPVVVFLL
jgi:hypothetical protein